MPILAVDQFGRFYETGRDRADGLGYSRGSCGVTQTDLTLGSAYLKSQAEQTRAQIGRAQAQQRQDQLDAFNRAKAFQANQQRIRQAQAEDQLLQNPRHQKAMLNRALMSGRRSHPVQGPNKSERAIRNAITGQGANEMYRISKAEAQQRQAVMGAQAKFLRDAVAKESQQRTFDQRQAQLRRANQIQNSVNLSPSYRIK